MQSFTDGPAPAREESRHLLGAETESRPANSTTSAVLPPFLARLAASAFLCYLTVGIPLPVLSLYVHDTLGFGDFAVGTVVGIQFAATVLTRKYAGTRSDLHGARGAVMRGLAISSLAGFCYLAAVLVPGSAWTKLMVLIAGRLILGAGESLMITGTLTWGIALAGQSRAGRVMSWTGMAVYGALALGSPIGLAIHSRYGFGAVACTVTLLPLLAMAVIRNVERAPTRAVRQPVPFRQVVVSVLRPGGVLALQGAGFGSIGAFISLYFLSQNWWGAGLALSAFGGAFVLVRLLFGHLPDRLGGYRVAWVSLLVETVGQLLLWKAQGPLTALAGAAITGLGCSLMFPALGTEVVRIAKEESRGAALGAFAAFQDVSYAITGPIMGIVATHAGYASIFLGGAALAVAGAVLAYPRENVAGAALPVAEEIAG
ncbi:arabinose transporter [Paludibaculum fermentans]|uniref:Arabinose transporter n=1 Tax=Paludibaculum fermentans TaxID=1473598 RepID=A0A7S7NXS4_PALFE|nr:arabinose transporter [Paludibaculum fermentans]QOY91706.1 arabinose transporter [Paludibaculum fermentans]